MSARLRDHLQTPRQPNGGRTMRRLIQRLEKRLKRARDFIGNVVYYIKRGHRPAKAIDLAKVTLP